MDKTISIPEPNTIAQSFTWKVKKLLLIGVNNGNEDPPICQKCLKPKFYRIIQHSIFLKTLFVV